MVYFIRDNIPIIIKLAKIIIVKREEENML